MKLYTNLIESIMHNLILNLYMGPDLLFFLFWNLCWGYAPVIDCSKFRGFLWHSCAWKYLKKLTPCSFFSLIYSDVIQKAINFFMSIVAVSKQRDIFFSYVNASLTGLKLILRNFAPVIKSNVTAPSSIGVDISREERFDSTVAPIHHSLSDMNFHVLMSL